MNFVNRAGANINFNLEEFIQPGKAHRLCFKNR